LPKYIRPVLNELERQIDDVHLNGSVGQLARLQVQDDANAAGGRISGAAAMHDIT
jgi:hypothetical protein